MTYNHLVQTSPTHDVLSVRLSPEGSGAVVFCFVYILCGKVDELSCQRFVSTYVLCGSINELCLGFVFAFCVGAMMICQVFCGRFFTPTPSSDRTHPQ